LIGQKLRTVRLFSTIQSGSVKNLPYGVKHAFKISLLLDEASVIDFEGLLTLQNSQNSSHDHDGGEC
jgi:hypothetical protein